MATEIKMPQLSDTMDSGRILAWKKHEGQQVNRGEILAEVETDKANLEIECFHPGTLLKIVVPAGSGAKVGDVIAIIGSPGEEVSAAKKPATEQAHSKPPAQAAHKTVALPEASSSVIQVSPDRVKASPLARKFAQQSNIDLSVVKGSGPGGRIIKRDLEHANAATGMAGAYPESKTAAGRILTSESGSPSGGPAGELAGGQAGQLRSLSKMRETIARRMQESIAQAPHFYMSSSIDMEQAVRLRELLKEKAEYKGLSLNHLVIKAAAYAIANERRVNCAMREAQVFEPEHINIGIITALEDGLMIPVIKQADILPLKDLAFEARSAVERVRAGRPTSADLSGGTFSISNMGMFDVENFTAIINPGQGAVLAVGAVRAEPAVKHGQIVIAQIMKVTLSMDHRLHDAMIGASFLKHFKQALENPALLLN